METLIIAALIGLIPAMIAQSKGKSFFLWWLYGAAIFIIALPHSLIMKADSKTVEQHQLSAGMKKCPYCAEMIKGDAKVCRYCQRDLENSNPVKESSRLISIQATTEPSPTGTEDQKPESISNPIKKSLYIKKYFVTEADVDRGMATNKIQFCWFNGEMWVEDKKL